MRRLAVRPEDHQLFLNEKKVTKCCCVPQCSNYAEKNRHFHHFPKDPKLRIKWKLALRMGKEITYYDVVCQDHFLSSDYIPNANTPARPFLKKIAIPSQKLPKRSHDAQETSPKKRLKIARHQRAEFRALAKDRVLEHDSDSASESEAEQPESSRETATPPNEIDSVPPSIEDPPSVENLTTSNAYSQTEKFSILTLLSNSGQLYSWTGMMSEKVIDNIASVASNYVKDSDAVILPMKLRIVLALIKLKVNLVISALAVLFGINYRTCRNDFRDTVQILVQIFKGFVYFPSKEEVLQNMPRCFKKFWKTRIVMDCFEIPIEKLKSIKEKILAYSFYKGTHTAKVNVCTSPDGLIVSVSKCFGGRTSDKKIVNKSGILDKCDYGDAIMVDRSYMIEDECAERGLILYRPPFLSQKIRLSKAESLETAEIARERVHIERVIKQLRTFAILSDKLKTNLLPFSDDIVLICAALVNLSAPVLALDKF